MGEDGGGGGRGSKYRNFPRSRQTTYNVRVTKWYRAVLILFGNYLAREIA